MGKAALWLVLLVFRAVLSGFVFSILWAWFVADTFGVRSLSIAEALGLSLVVSYFLVHLKREEYFPKDKPETQRMAYMTALQVLTAVLMVGIAWVVRQFV